MITAASGCDNVDWGGAELRLVPPPSTAPEATVAADSVPSEPDLGLPEGPVLYRGTRDGDSVTLVPVAEIRGDSMLPVASEDDPSYREAFIRDHLPPGAEFILFAGGARVGRIRVETVDTDASFCTPRPSATGVAEVLPTAATADRFLALSVEHAASRPFGAYQAPEHTFPQRSASVEQEIEVLRRVRARFPPDDLVNHRVDMRALSLGTDADGSDAYVATFVHLDAARIAPADSAAYATFLLGVQSGDAYRPAYDWHRSVDGEGKGVPLFWGQMDWDGDGETEILLEVLGAESRWSAALARQGARWTRIFQDPCGTAPTTAGD
jgi:hypothetical protein